MSAKTARDRALLERTIRSIEPPDASIRALADARQARLTKPPGSLGLLEEIASRVASVQRTLEPRVDSRAVLVFAGDHGVTAEGVSPYPSEVTAQMVANFLAGGGAINAIARTIGADVLVVDVGVAAEIPAAVDASGLVRRKVAPGTRNFARERAMSEDEALAAIAVGIETASEAAASGVEILALGEMGIGNTTAASAITVALTGRPASEVTGRGTGVDDEALAHKTAVVERAIALHATELGTPLGVLSCVGGFEIGAICGAALGAAARGVLVTVDGFISTAGVALAAGLAPEAKGYMLAGHRSAEPGHTALLEHLGLRPVLDLGMRLGEGTGAALAVPVVAAAVAAFREMATFESAGVSNRDADE
jgi:nicotinate-nucleotide--dimethylbenzimidazole phosphoribosyltransferase